MEGRPTPRRRLTRNPQAERIPEAEYRQANYVDLMLDLPWEKKSLDNFDLQRRVPDEDHYGLEKVKERIIEHLLF